MASQFRLYGRRVGVEAGKIELQEGDSGEILDRDAVAEQECKQMEEWEIGASSRRVCVRMHLQNMSWIFFRFSW